jgi:hypothetical protein
MHTTRLCRSCGDRGERRADGRTRRHERASVGGCARGRGWQVHCTALHCTRASRRRYFGRLGHSALPGPIDVSALAWLAVGSRRVGRMRGYSLSRMDSNDRAVITGWSTATPPRTGCWPSSIAGRAWADESTVGLSDRARCVPLASLLMRTPRRHDVMCTVCIAAIAAPA